MSKIKISNRQWLVIILIGLAFVIVIGGLLKYILRNNTTKEIDYANINAQILVDKSPINTDKGIYWSLNDIVETYLNSYVSTEKVNQKKKHYVSYKKYYKILTKNYKEYLGKSGYEKTAEVFLKKFAVNSALTQDGKPYQTMDTSRVLKQVYTYDAEENMYLCELESELVGKIGYIGIKLDPNNADWFIFLIE